MPRFGSHPPDRSIAHFRPTYHSALNLRRYLELYPMAGLDGPTPRTAALKRADGHFGRLEMRRLAAVRLRDERKSALRSRADLSVAFLGRF